MEAGHGIFVYAFPNGHHCEVFEPSGDPLAVVLCLHDIQPVPLADQAELIAQLAQHGLAAVAPHTGRSWWTDRICPAFDPRISAERHVLDHVLPYIRQRWEMEPLRLALFGTGMGGQGALRLAYKHPVRFPVVAALYPAIDFQQDYEEDEVLQSMYPDPEAVRQDSALLYVHPLNWPRHQFFACDPRDEQCWDSNDRLRMKLWSLGVPFECDLETSTAGDRSAYQRSMTARAIAFLVDRLESERLRLA